MAFNGHDYRSLWRVKLVQRVICLTPNKSLAQYTNEIVVQWLLNTSAVVCTEYI